MARNPLFTVVGLAFAPARVAGRVAAGVARELTGGAREAEPAPSPEAPTPPPPPRPKDLDDVTIARKVESIVFRDRKVAKGKVDVNVAEGVVWLRGEVRTPELVREVEARAREVPEVRGVENLLHLPKTPAPTRADTPPSQQKTHSTSEGENREPAPLGAKGTTT
jgi:BON domain